MDHEQDQAAQTSATMTAPPRPDASSAAPPRPRRRLAPYLAAMVMMLAGLGVGYGVWCDSFPLCDNCTGEEEEDGLPPSSQLANEYTKWQRPLVALVISGQMHGYIHPCGCSSPQYGGLVRRFNFIDSLLTGQDGKKGWDVVGIDLGELPQIQGIHPQNLLKYELSMKALALSHYRAVGIGKDEILSPLGEALAQAWSKERPMPRPLSLTLAQTAPGQDYYSLNVRPYEIVDDTRPKIGIISMIGPDMREMLKSKEKFLNNQTELPKALKALADAGVEVGVILHHEYPDVKGQQGIAQMLAVEKQRKEMARLCAQFCADERRKNPKIPAIQLMVVLTDEPEPPAKMQALDPRLPTQVVEIGHKGKYVGLAGVYRDGKGYKLQYQIVGMGPEWVTKDEKKKTHPVIALMEQYNQELKRQNMLDKFPRTLHFSQIPDPGDKGLKSTFVGSDRCGDCHPHAYKIWETRPGPEPWHSVATETLEKEEHPSGAQFDPECMMCHTVGLKHPGGYNDPVDAALWPARAAPVDAAHLKKHNDKLRNVGCESCHGPASLHVKNPNNKAVYPLINPFGPSAAERKLEEALKQAANPKDQAAFKKLFDRRLSAMEQFCTKCHDHENDVNWGKPGKEIVDKWNRIIHRTPKNNGGGVPPGGVGPPNPIPPLPIQINLDPAGTPIIDIAPEKKK